MLQLALIVHLGSQFVQNHVWKVRWWKYGPYLSQDSRSRNIEHILLHTGSRIWVLERYFKNWSTGPTGGWDSYIWPWGIISTTLTQVCFPSVFPSCLTKTEARGRYPATPTTPHRSPIPLKQLGVATWKWMNHLFKRSDGRVPSTSIGSSDGECPGESGRERK